MSKVSKNSYQRFNKPDTLIVVSSFPLLGEEIAQRNAVSRYTDLLLSNFSESRKIVVLCEAVSDQNNQAYLFEKNILVLPSFQTNSLSLFTDLAKQIKQFTQVKNILLQFEFSLFGKELITFLLPFFFLYQRILGKKIFTMFHQVVLDLATLSGQVALPAGALKTKIFNRAIKDFYCFFALASNLILVHDQFLAERLKTIIPKRKIKIIPHGINGYQSFSDKQKEKIRSTFNFKKADQILLAYGYHSWYKGTDWLVKNFLRLKENGSLPKNTKLLLAGDVAPTQKNQTHLRSYYHNISKLIQENPESIVHTGFVAEKEVAKIFAIADLLIFPYRTRMSSSGALALAFQYRKPFIYSKTFAENLKTAAILKEFEKIQLDLKTFSFSFNLNSFSQTLNRTMANEKMKQNFFSLGKAISQQQSWVQVAEQYQDVINEEKRVAMKRKVFSTDFLLKPILARLDSGT